MTAIPDCEICTESGEHVPAWADAQIPGWGSWAYLCLLHFQLYGCTLGTGHGQVLVLHNVYDSRDPNRTRQQRHGRHHHR